MRSNLPVAYVVTAPSDWYKLTYDEPEPLKEPILAFAITKEGYAAPIVPFQHEIKDDNYVLLYPDGRVDNNCEVFEDIASWCKAMKAAQDKEISSIATDMVKHARQYPPDREGGRAPYSLPSSVLGNRQE